MNTTSRVKTADKVQEAFSIWKKGALAQHLGMTYPTLRKRLKDNFWEASEIETLKRLGIL